MEHPDEDVEVEKKRSYTTNTIESALASLKSSYNSSKSSGAGSNATWQWQEDYDSGDATWSCYEPRESRRIERAFQRGLAHLRLKSDTHDGTPIEIFFHDKVQYNPVTGCACEIRRLGTESICQRVTRKGKGFIRFMLTGTTKHKSFLKHNKQLRERRHEEEAKKRKNETRLKVRASTGVLEDQYNSEICRRIAITDRFYCCQAAVIILSIVFLGLGVDHNGMEASSSTRVWFEVVDHFLCTVFLFEILIRFGAKKSFCTLQQRLNDILNDAWFMFDSFLVICSVIETWLVPLCLMATGSEQDSNTSSTAALRMLRLLRLTRLARIGGVLRYFPEMLTMISSILASLRAVTCTTTLIFLFLYGAAIIFATNAMGTNLEAMFDSIPYSMWQLLTHAAFMDRFGDTMETIYAVDPGLAVLFFITGFICNLTMLNMLTGVICQVASEVNESEKTRSASEALKTDVEEFLQLFDVDNDGSVSAKEFELLLQNPDVCLLFQSYGIDVHVVHDLKETLFKDEGQITHDELVSFLLRFTKGHGGTATMIDVINLERSVCSRFDELHAMISQTNIRKVTSIKKQNSFKEHYERPPSRLFTAQQGCNASVLHRSVSAPQAASPFETQEVPKAVGGLLNEGETEKKMPSDGSSPILLGSREILAEGLPREGQTEIDIPIPPEEVQAVLEELRLKMLTPESECIPAASSLSLPPVQYSVTCEGERKSNEASGKVFAESSSSDEQTPPQQLVPDEHSVSCEGEQKSNEASGKVIAEGPSREEQTPPQQLAPEEHLYVWFNEESRLGRKLNRVTLNQKASRQVVSSCPTEQSTQDAFLLNKHTVNVADLFNNPRDSSRAQSPPQQMSSNGHIQPPLKLPSSDPLQRVSELELAELHARHLKEKKELECKVTQLEMQRASFQQEQAAMREVLQKIHNENAVYNETLKRLLTSSRTMDGLTQHI